MADPVKAEADRLEASLLCDLLMSVPDDPTVQLVKGLLERHILQLVGRLPFLRDDQKQKYLSDMDAAEAALLWIRTFGPARPRERAS